MSCPVVGVDVGGSKIAAAVVDSAGAVLARLSRPLPTEGAEAVEDAVVVAVEDVVSGGDAAAVGVGVAGLVDTDTSQVAFAPHLPWRHQRLGKVLSARLGLPVLVDNDANAAAWGEWRLGAGRGCDPLVCVTVGTGIGGGIVLGGQLYRGKHGMAGEFGHIVVLPGGAGCPCGGRGCWERYASASALVDQARRLVLGDAATAQGLLAAAGGDPGRIDGRTVTAAAHAGDATAAELLVGVGDWLGVGLANLAAAFDPECFVVAGGLAGAGPLVLDPARTAFRRTLVGRGFRAEASIKEAQLGPDAVCVGAAELARAGVPTSAGPLAS